MLIMTQSNRGFVNFDNVLHLYATQYGAVMIRTINDVTFALADYETEQEALDVVAEIKNAYMESNGVNFVYEIPDRPTRRVPRW